MGTALASRWEAAGRSVRTWSRSDGSGPSGLDAAVADTATIVLSLFDGVACDEVLQRIRPHLGPGCLVLNTSTVSPAEAVALAETVAGTGARYLHAPIVGSTSAVRSGAATILVGGDPQPVKALLCEIASDTRRFADSAEAAAAKLVTNLTLGGALATIGDALRLGSDLGLSRDVALDAIRIGPMGALAEKKGPHLTGRRELTDSDFTAAALVKDVRLATAAQDGPNTTARQVTRIVEQYEFAPDADIAAVCLVSPPSEEVLQPLRSYALGHATGNPRHFREAFRPTAHIEGIRNGRFMSWDVDTYCGMFSGKPAADEAHRSRWIAEVDVTGSVASAVMTLDHVDTRFTDMFLLVREGRAWRIANKVYHRHR